LLCGAEPVQRASFAEPVPDLAEQAQCLLVPEDCRLVLPSAELHCTQAVVSAGLALLAPGLAAEPKCVLVTCDGSNVVAYRPLHDAQAVERHGLAVDDKISSLQTLRQAMTGVLHTAATHAGQGQPVRLCRIIDTGRAEPGAATRQVFQPTAPTPVPGETPAPTSPRYRANHITPWARRA